MSSKASKKTTQKSAVAGSKLSRHRDEKRKTKKVKKSVKGSASKRSHSPSKAKSKFVLNVTKFLFYKLLHFKTISSGGN